MKDENKTKKQLINELSELSKRVDELENSESGSMYISGAARQSEDLYHSLFEQAADPIVLIDPRTGEFIEFNESAYKDLGYT